MNPKRTNGILDFDIAGLLLRCRAALSLLQSWQSILIASWDGLIPAMLEMGHAGSPQVIPSKSCCASSSDYAKLRLMLRLGYALRLSAAPADHVNGSYAVHSVALLSVHLRKERLRLT